MLLKSISIDCENDVKSLIANLSIIDKIHMLNDRMTNLVNISDHIAYEKKETLKELNSLIAELKENSNFDSLKNAEYEEVLDFVQCLHPYSDKVYGSINVHADKKSE